MENSILGSLLSAMIVYLFSLADLPDGRVDKKTMHITLQNNSTYCGFNQASLI